LEKTSVVLALSCSLLTLLAGCASNSRSALTGDPDPAPSILSSSVSATANPLVASYTVTLPQAANVSVEFGPTTSYGFSTSPQHTPSTGPQTVQVLVAGMKAGSAYHMRAKVEYDTGFRTTGADQTFTTGAIPAGILPDLTATPTSGLTPQPGVELVDAILPSSHQSPFATDVAGNVVWYYSPAEAQAPGELLAPIKLLPNGHWMVLFGPNPSAPLSGPISPSTPTLLREFDLAGNAVRQITIAELNTRLAAANFPLTMQIFTHDFQLLPNGHILVITNLLKQVNGVNVLGDAVVDLDQDLNPVWVWNAFDHLDVNRQPMGFPDWTHANALAYSADDGNFLISIRHQHWVLKIDYRDGAGTGNILWHLGPQGDFHLQGASDPTDWFYAQHDVNFVSSNTTGTFKIAIMDNGDYRVLPDGSVCGVNGAAPCYSTAAIMQIDEKAMTASFLFQQKVDPNLYNSCAGSTRVLPNGNVEYNLGGVNNGAFTYEVTPTATPQVVWQMFLNLTSTYRSYRMTSLYPGVEW
jgi:arylsulfate sulfotransferase